MIKFFQLDRHDIANSKTFNGVLLVLLFTLFSLIYVSSVIAPQVGWWQYYAWRMEEGDILYKDVYLFITPYFVFLTRILYSLFHEHLMLYTLFVGFPVKLACVLVLYHMLCKIAKPLYACLSVFLGACLSASYFTDLLYDFNPITMLPCLLLACCYMSYFKRVRDGRNARPIAFVIGLLLGIILGFKQTFGITFTAVVIGLSIVIVLKKEYPGRLQPVVRSFGYIFLGLLVGILPMLAYLTVYDCWNEFIYCTTVIRDAKGGGSQIFLRCLLVFDDFKIWVYMAVILVLWQIQKFFLGDGSNYGMGISMWRRNRLTLVIDVGMVSAVVAYGILPLDFHEEIASNVFLHKWNTRVYRLLVYASASAWAVCAFRYFIGLKVNRSLLVFTTIIVVHFFTGIISTDFLEPIYLLFYVPWLLVVALHVQCSFKRLKNSVLLVLICVFSFYCISCKIVTPYSWQGWTEPSVSHANVSCSVRGLEGFSVPEKVDEAFGRIVELIESNTTADDQVYQFANIPLFNVITKRQIPTYVPIAWFDVCSDSLAQQTARQLRNDPPKIVIWHSMDKSNWDVVEDVFRGGKKSGQRHILAFYNDVVRKDYSCLYSVYNHRDGDIELWVRKDRYE